MASSFLNVASPPVGTSADLTVALLLEEEGTVMETPAETVVRGWDPETLYIWLESLRPHPLVRDSARRTFRDAEICGSVFIGATEQWFRELPLPAGVAKMLWILAGQIRRNVPPSVRKRARASDITSAKKARVGDTDSDGSDLMKEAKHSSEAAVRKLESMSMFYADDICGY